jgi:hypothetical protein
MVKNTAIEKRKSIGRSQVEVTIYEGREKGDTTAYRIRAVLG